MNADLVIRLASAAVSIVSIINRAAADLRGLNHIQRAELESLMTALRAQNTELTARVVAILRNETPPDA